MGMELIAIIIICVHGKDLFTPHVISVAGCEISSVNVVADVESIKATITFSTDLVPVNDTIRFRCKLDQNRYQPCE